MLEAIYSLLDILPFACLEHNFMKNAFLAVILVTPVFGLLSTMVVSNRMAFFSDSLGHGAFTGLAIGVMLGGISPFMSLIVFSILFSFLITYIKRKSTVSTDTVIGVFSSTAIAFGLMLLSRGGSFNKFSSYLIGDVLSIAEEDLLMLFFILIGVIIVWGIIFNKLLVLSVNPVFARSRGISVLQIESIFAALLAVIVAVSIQWVGLLIINSLLVLPAAVARNLSNNVKSYHLISIAGAMLYGICGLVMAYYLDMAAGASIVSVAAICFFISLLLRPYFVRG